MAKAIKTNHVSENILNREFTSHGPRKVLLTDITYIPYNGNYCYLSTILDAYTKQILSYVLSDSLEVDFVLETVRKVVREHGMELGKETSGGTGSSSAISCTIFTFDLDLSYMTMA